jgi:hypothetical protein
LVNEQFGFREKSSTKMATHYLLNTVLSSLDKNNSVGGLFCDLQNTFDCVNHDTLLAKLEFYGISGIVNKLMKSYLNNRYQRTAIKDNISNKLSSELELVKHGIPHSDSDSDLFTFHISNKDYNSPYRCGNSHVSNNNLLSIKNVQSLHNTTGYKTCHNFWHYI